MADVACPCVVGLLCQFVKAMIEVSFLRVVILRRTACTATTPNRLRQTIRLASGQPGAVLAPPLGGGSSGWQGSTNFQRRVGHRKNFVNYYVQISPADPEITGLQETSKTEKKLRKAKYIARSASLPSGLNYDDKKCHSRL